MPRVAFEETLTIVPPPRAMSSRDRCVAAPERWHERPANLRFDLSWLETIVGPHADRATDIVYENVEAAEAADCFGHGS